MKFNEKNLVMQSVQGVIAHPKAGASPYRVDREGMGNILPATGGITYNVSIGDPAFGWAGDHIEPGVSMKIVDNNQGAENMGLATLACIGNRAKVVSGKAEGAEGFVTGTHGGIDHVLIYFEAEELEKMKIGDEILIKAYGQGIKIRDYPEIKVFNIDPTLLKKLNIKEEDGKLKIGVAAEIPGEIMGSGIGSSSVGRGDYDITTGDTELIRELEIDKLRLGDIVYLKDCDNTYGREFKRGAGSIGVVIHSDCIKMGHGPGVTTLFTAKNNLIETFIDKEANLINYFD
ncbi:MULTISPECIES: DUF4438 domain-containing protein [unclassified Halanaerobium]|uniref:DUF4438 domain-containing protein n=1 Tax=unclassified Halanaerobium TaxID=2641197 RepID=UPI000DF2C08F|nr:MULTISPECIES: DUF4438 domain-containing protein [unclassified Halanaerobium]RCW46353.1 uncharacterized protein DUF4438 [Halanaerobium sp. MA284_MarDTE_T2]RCW82512.1 uncharacterized protein DUF4438 [Halanaerobium sp. DL-01]